MRTKGLTTAGIWVVAMIVIDRLITSLRYTEFIDNPNYLFDLTTMPAMSATP